MRQCYIEVPWVTYALAIASQTGRRYTLPAATVRPRIQTKRNCGIPEIELRLPPRLICPILCPLRRQFAFLRKKEKEQVEPFTGKFIMSR